MIKKLALTVGTVALAVAGAASSYSLQLFQPATVGGTQLKAGDYKLELKDNKAVFKQGKTQSEVPVKVESTERKADSTAVKYANGAIQEIRLGGTRTRLVFEN